MKINRIHVAALALVLLTSPARADQTTLVTPAVGSATMANLRTYLNAVMPTLAGCFSGTSAPAVAAGGVPVPYQCWADTSISPTINFKVYNPTLSAWTLTYSLNLTTGIYTPNLNGNTFTAGTGTLTIAAGKTFTANNTMTVTATDGSTVSFGAGGTVTYAANNLSVFASTTSAQLRGVISDETGTGFAVFSISPVLTTPNIGVATATSINGNIWTAGTGTLNIGSNSVTFGAAVTTSGAFSTGAPVTHSGAFASTFTVVGVTNSTFPAGTHTLSGLDVTQSWTGPQTFANGDFILAGATSGTMTFKTAAVSGASSITWPAGVVDFSASGPGYLKQTTAGNFISVSAIAAADLPLVANASGGTPSPTAGALKCDGSTIVCAGGVATASGASATAITPGSTSIAGGSGVSGGVLTDSAGVLGNTAAGVVGQRLTSNGAGVQPTFQSGGWTLLNTLVASSSSTLTDTTSFTAAYSEYEIVFEDLNFSASSSSSCQLQVHNGSGVQTTGYLSTASFAGSSSGQTNSTTFIPCSVGGSASSTAPLHTVLRVNNPSAATLHSWTGYTTSSLTGVAWIGNIGGWWNTSSAIDGFQISPTTGTMTNGKVKIYGRL